MSYFHFHIHYLSLKTKIIYSACKFDFKSANTKLGDDLPPNTVLPSLPFNVWLPKFLEFIFSDLKFLYEHFSYYTILPILPMLNYQPLMNELKTTLQTRI